MLICLIYFYFGLYLHHYFKSLHIFKVLILFGSLLLTKAAEAFIF